MVEARRGFVIAASKTGRCVDVPPQTRPAIETNIGLFVDRDFTYAAVHCYEQNESLDVAFQALRRLHHGDPSVVDDVRYVRLAKKIISAQEVQDREASE